MARSVHIFAIEKDRSRRSYCRGELLALDGPETRIVTVIREYYWNPYSRSEKVHKERSQIGALPSHTSKDSLRIFSNCAGRTPMWSVSNLLYVIEQG